MYRQTSFNALVEGGKKAEMQWVDVDFPSAIKSFQMTNQIKTQDRLQITVQKYHDLQTDINRFIFQKKGTKPNLCPQSTKFYQHSAICVMRLNYIQDCDHRINYESKFSERPCSARRKALHNWSKHGCSSGTYRATELSNGTFFLWERN